MQLLSAIDAISPAWNHTRKLLLEPMRWQTLLKIGVVAAFAGASSGNFNFNNFNHAAGLRHAPINVPAAAALVSLLVLGGIVLLVIGLAFFYLGSRLQFVLFDVVLRRDTRIGLIWRRYGPATWRWMGLRILFLLAAAILLSPFLVPAILQFIHAVSASGADQPNVRTFLGPLLAFVGATLLALIVIGIGSLLLRSFGLPSMALEATPLPETAARVWRLICAEPLQVLLYVVMRIILQIAASILGAITLGIGAFVVLIPLGGGAGILWAALHHGGVSARFSMWFVIALIAMLFVMLFVTASFMVCGVMETFFQAYALYFLGGRYPLLGSMLVPSPDRPFSPAAVFPSDDGRRHDIGGPAVPIDPSVR